MAWYDEKLMVGELQGPAYLADALVNGDMTGFDCGTPGQAKEDLDMLAQFEALVLAEFGPTAYITGCLGDSDFGVLYNLTPTYRGDVVTYTVLYDKEAE